MLLTGHDHVATVPMKTHLAQRYIELVQVVQVVDSEKFIQFTAI